MEERIYLVGAEDEAGDHHIFMTNDRERALAAYHRLEQQHGAVNTNDAVAEALRTRPTVQTDDE